MSKFSKYENLLPKLLEKIKQRNRLKSKAYRTGYPGIKRRSNHAAEEIKRDLRDLHNQNWKTKLQSLKTQDGTFFKKTRALIKGTKKPLPYIAELFNNKVYIEP